MEYPSFIPLQGEQDPKSHLLHLSGGKGPEDSVSLVLQQCAKSSGALLSSNSGGNNTGSSSGSAQASVFLLPSTLVLTPLRLFLGPSGSKEGIYIPLVSIDSFAATLASTKLKKKYMQSCKEGETPTDGNSNKAKRAGSQRNDKGQSIVLYVLHIRTKTIQDFSFLLRSKSMLDMIRAHIKGYGVRLHSVRDLPAFTVAARTTDEIEMANSALFSSENAANEDQELFQLCLEQIDFGWNIHDVQTDLQRQISSHCADRFHIVDQRPPGEGSWHGFSPTLPWRLVLPAGVTAAQLARAVPAREEGRVPVITYVHPTGASLSRSGQPLTMSTRSKQDADVCHLLVNQDPSSTVEEARPVEPVRQPLAKPKSLYTDSDKDEEDDDTVSPPSEEVTPEVAGKGLYVADCRPFTSAEGNRLRGGGYERAPLYSRCITHFYEIDNIYGVMSAFKKLKLLLQSVNGVGSLTTSTLYAMMESKHKGNPEVTFWRDLMDTKWLQIVQRVLVCGMDIALHLSRGQSTLVHCTSGWDRTSQCSGLAQLLIDPFYRTIFGFCSLIEKEFVSFGHRLAERTGTQTSHTLCYEEMGEKDKMNAVHADDAVDGQLNESPIVLQFMDIVYQVLRQSPHAFEFTQELLLFVAGSLYTGEWGTWLCNNEQERELEGVWTGCRSLWSYILRQTELEKRGEVPLQFVNEHYDHATAWAGLTSGSKTDVLHVNTSMKRVIFWEELYLQYDSECFMQEFREGTTLRGGLGVRRKQISYGPAFDRYLRTLLIDACRRRLEGLPVLRQRQARLQALLADPHHTAVTYRNTMIGSKRCFWENDNQCEHCMEPFNAWREALYLSARHTCECCGFVFCKKCIAPEVHGCPSQKGITERIE